MTTKQSEKQVTCIYESDLFLNDNDFHIEYLREKHDWDWKTAEEKLDEYEFTADEIEEIEEEKDEYYRFEFWNDCDYIKYNGETYRRRCIDNEIIFDGFEIEVDDVLVDIVKHYMSDDWQDKSIEADFDRGDWFAKLQNESDADVWIKYRGGAGYTYAFCGYNYKDFE